MKLKIKTGDDVIVLSGKNKGQKGRVEKVYPKLGMVKVKDVNVVKRHMKPRKAGEKGVIVEINKPIRSSVVSLLADDKATRVRYEMKDNRKVRVSVKTGKEI
ncbi:MAG: 50S ribosomal protein L24 [bacterium]|nr:50S ribosomal protein L24 [bacterium]